MALDQNNPPVTSPITEIDTSSLERALSVGPLNLTSSTTPVWTRYFLALQMQIRDLQANSGGGSSVLPDQYRVLDPVDVFNTGSFGTLDYTAYNGITLDLLVDRQLYVTDPAYVGNINDRKGKRLTLLMTFSGSNPGISIAGLTLTAPMIANQTVTDTAYYQVKRGAIEWRFNETGDAHLCYMYQVA